MRMKAFFSTPPQMNIAFILPTYLWMYLNLPYKISLVKMQKNVAWSRCLNSWFWRKKKFHVEDVSFLTIHAGIIAHNNWGWHIAHMWEWVIAITDFIVTDDSCLTIEQCVIAHKLWAMSHPSIVRGGLPTQIQWRIRRQRIKNKNF